MIVISLCSYDLHGWLTGIQVSGRNELGYSDTLFEELLHYESPKKDPMARRFDGNISETTFRHWAGIPSGGSASFHAPNEDTWSYAYDALKRLTGANHFVGLSQTSSLTDTEREIAYDLNGNMIALKRYNSTGLENDLAYLHTGNRMTSLSDAHATGSGAGPKTFTYDANGNLTYDGRQDLDIRWNIFNLASGAETHDGGSLTLARLSDGTLFAQQNVSGGNTTGKRYCGSFVFTTGTGNTTPQVESITWEEGRIFRDAQTGTYRDCWFAGDHLGNVRSVLDITPDVTFPVPLEQNDYLPFGTKIANPLHAQMNTNRWRYAGKEEFPDLNLLELGARMYDSFTARWTAVDPMAGKYTGTSPYAYCADNPVNLVDPSGRIIVFVNGFTQRWTGAPGKGGEAYWHPGGSFVRTAQSIFNDSKTFFPDIRYSFTSSANQRRKDGYEYAKQNVSHLVGDLKKGESIRFVSHSMGAAFAEGMADYLIENGFPVDALIHFEPYQAARIKSNGGRDDILSIDFQDIEDWVIQYISPGEMPDADHSIRVNYGATWDRIHTISIAGKMSWDEIQSLIDDFLNNDKD